MIDLPPLLQRLCIPIFAIMRVWGALMLTRRMGWLDRPGIDTGRTHRVPTVQGLFLVSGCLLGIMLFVPGWYRAMEIWLYMIGAIILTVITTRDTFGETGVRWLSPLPALVRLAAQVAVGSLVRYMVYRTQDFALLTQIPLISSLPETLISLIEYGIIVCWFVFFINAINRFDGVSGLASGVSAVGYITIALLLWLVVFPQYGASPLNHQIALICMIVGVFAVLYAIVETKPRGLLRDIGVMFWGYGLAYFSLVGGAKVGIILTALSLVVMDALRVFFYRVVIKRKNPLHKDYSHLHYRLLALGRRRSEIRASIWLVSIMFMILMLLQGTDRIDKMIIFGLGTLTFVGTHIYLYLYRGLPREYTPPRTDRPNNALGTNDQKKQ